MACVAPAPDSRFVHDAYVSALCAFYSAPQPGRSADRGDDGQVMGQNTVRVLTNSCELKRPRRGTPRNLQANRKRGSTPC